MGWRHLLRVQVRKKKPCFSFLVYLYFDALLSPVNLSVADLVCIVGRNAFIFPLSSLQVRSNHRSDLSLSWLWLCWFPLQASIEAEMAARRCSLLVACVMIVCPSSPLREALGEI
eukprot:RCo041786